ncbi:OprO/OprP family phosphate-selective porin [Rhodopirellula sp. P2]|uniref:OprO/OprP family phosphate-selective porin n=1 Tax=Rhodopirellula sp. P2 TaxID=2127060 RepID=UPI002368B696|nr:porin [Rhodopirellula sp. P2]WDQ16195.1 porin [Rhodopirellula sp. P2]
MGSSSMRRGGSVARQTLAALVCLVTSSGTVANADEWWSPASQVASDPVLASPESQQLEVDLGGMLSNQYSAAPVRPQNSLLEDAVQSLPADVDQQPSGLSSLATEEPNRETLAEDESFEDRLEAFASRLDALDTLDEEWTDYQDELAAEAKAKKKKSTLKIGGRVHIDHWSFSNTDAGINQIESGRIGGVAGDPNQSPENITGFRRLRLELSGEVPQNMRYRLQVDFNNPQTPEIKDAYIGWSNLPSNQVLLLGNQKRPLGLDHLNSSRFNVFAERPLAVEAFNEDARRFGLTMYGHNNEESIGWAYGIYNLENINTDGRFIGDSAQAGGYSRLWGSPWYDDTSGGRGYWHWGLAGAVAKPDGDAGANDTNSNEGRFRTRPLARSSQRWLNTGRIDGADWYQNIGFENILNLGSLQITGEYIMTPMQVEDPAAGVDDNLFFHGGYIYASYFLTGEHMPYNRSTGTLSRVTPHENFFLVDRCNGCRGNGWGAWQVAFRYDHLDLTDGGVNGGVGNLYTAGLNWHWTPYSKVQNNLVWGEISESGLAANGNNSLDAPVEAGNFLIFGTRFMVDF